MRRGKLVGSSNVIPQGKSVGLALEYIPKRKENLQQETAQLLGIMSRYYGIMR